MKAVVWHRPRTVSVDEVDDPKAQEPADAMIKVTAGAICGSDLHIYDGVEPGHDGCAAHPGGARSARLGLSVAPFAYAAVWIANAGSLSLPVSNLTNLLAVNRLRLSARRTSSGWLCRRW